MASRRVEQRQAYEIWKHTDIRQDTVYLRVGNPMMYEERHIKTADPLFDHPTVYGKGSFMWEDPRQAQEPKNETPTHPTDATVASHNELGQEIKDEMIQDSLDFL